MDKLDAKTKDIRGEAIDDIDGRVRRIPGTDSKTDDDANANVGVDAGLLAGDEERGGSRSGSKVPVRRGSAKSLRSVEVAIPNLNKYQNRKLLAQGMMDLALLSANANQLRHVLETKKDDWDPYYYTSLILISLSIIFQIGVGVGLIWNYRNSMKNDEEICRANRINNYTVIGIFIVTVINVLIPSFFISEKEHDPTTTTTTTTATTTATTPSSLST